MTGDCCCGCFAGCDCDCDGDPGGGGGIGAGFCSWTMIELLSMLLADASLIDISEFEAAAEVMVLFLQVKSAENIFFTKKTPIVANKPT